LILQTVGGSKYARSIKTRVAQWESDLNLISDVIDVWMQVQRKWIYLESIFSSEDIKLQLPEEAKKFSKTNTTYTKMMESCQKDSRVLY
jgi:dynein heavy chain